MAVESVRISSGVASDFGGKAIFVALDVEYLGFADTPGQRVNEAFLMRQRDGVARPEPIELCAHAGNTPILPSHSSST